MSTVVTTLSGPHGVVSPREREENQLHLALSARRRPGGKMQLAALVTEQRKKGDRKKGKEKKRAASFEGYTDQ